MFSNKSVFVLTIIVALALINTATSLKCYTCWSDTKGNCGLGFQNTTSEVLCREGQMCCTRVTLEFSGYWVQRDCSTAAICDFPNYRPGHSCDTDLCNNEIVYMPDESP